MNSHTIMFPICLVILNCALIQSMNEKITSDKDILTNEEAMTYITLIQEGKRSGHYNLRDAPNNNFDTSLKKFRNINAKNKNGITLLHFCIEYHNYLRSKMKSRCKQLVKGLLRCGIDPNAQDTKGNTALHILKTYIDTDLTDLIYILLENGADPYIQNNRGRLPLHKIFKYSPNRLVVQRLYGMPNENKNYIQDNDGNTVLMHAIKKTDNFTLFQDNYLPNYLIDQNFPLNIRNTKNHTALFFAIQLFLEERFYPDPETLIMNLINKLFYKGAQLYLPPYQKWKEAPIFSELKPSRSKELHKFLQRYSHEIFMIHEYEYYKHKNNFDLKLMYLKH